MVTVLDRNVHNLAVRGTFDDCQVITEQDQKLRFEANPNRISSRHSFTIPILMRA